MVMVVVVVVEVVKLSAVLGNTYNDSSCDGGVWQWLMVVMSNNDVVVMIF